MSKLFLIIFMFIFGIQTVGLADVSEEQFNTLLNKFEDMQKRMDKLEAKVISQEQQIKEQEAAKEVSERRIEDLQQQLARQEPTPAQPISATPPMTKWVPEIGVVGDIVYKQDSAKLDEDGADRLSVREVELVLGSAVDPFSRLDATIAFSELEGVDLEEAYLTRFGLPWDTTARLGKFKPKVGKILPAHRDSLDTVDEPLVIQRYFGQEGLNKSGVDLTTTLNLPWPITHQAVFGILGGGSEEDNAAFSGGAERRPILYSHLKNYIDLNDQTGFELGFSHMTGSRDEDAKFEVQVLASDVTLTHQLNAQQSLKLQGEVFNVNRAESFIETEEDDGLGGTITVRNHVDGNVWGEYGLLDFRFHPQWATGFRYDNVQLIDNPLENPRRKDIGYTGYLTFYQSELSRWRLQYTHSELATGKDDNTVYLQGTFAIGEHKHKLQ